MAFMMSNNVKMLIQYILSVFMHGRGAKKSELNWIQNQLSFFFLGASLVFSIDESHSKLLSIVSFHQLQSFTHS